jgi:hypothetical protein
MKFDFSADEMNALLYSLISHRNSLKKLISRKYSITSHYYRLYRKHCRSKIIHEQELQTVESLMEKMFPGSIKAIDSP